MSIALFVCSVNETDVDFYITQHAFYNKAKSAVKFGPSGVAIGKKPWLLDCATPESRLRVLDFSVVVVVVVDDLRVTPSFSKAATARNFGTNKITKVNTADQIMPPHTNSVWAVGES